MGAFLMATLLSIGEHKDWRYWIRGGLNGYWEREGVMTNALTFIHAK